MNGLLESLLEDVVHPVSDVQKAVSIALFSLLKDSPINATNIALKKLLTLYNSKITVSFVLYNSNIMYVVGSKSSQNVVLFFYNYNLNFN